MSKKTRKLWFKRSNGERVFLTRVKDKNEAFLRINEFLKEHNYTCYYMRTWMDEDENVTWIDVGSHTEFFILEEIT